MLHIVNQKWHVRSTLRHTQPICKVDFTKCKYLTLFYINILPIQKKAVLLHHEIKITFINKQQNS